MRRRRVDLGPRRILDETTLQVMVGDEVLEAAAQASPAAPRHIARSGKRAEDTAVGCRANAAANLVGAGAPGGDYMRVRLEHSAAVWSARADLLERIEQKAGNRAAARAA
ncbi:MAG: hypothetical protein E6G92_02165 [Alphaproteobacteria bacterium]|nr:MAG: hypothetical protein E6G92_02165 [Alphaproteobacteria bacterium]